MSETRSQYLVSGPLGGPRQETLLPFSNPNYMHPTWEDVRALMLVVGWTGGEVAQITGVHGRTVRKWASSPDVSNHADIPYAAWRLLIIEAKIDVNGSTDSLPWVVSDHVSRQIQILNDKLSALRQKSPEDPLLINNPRAVFVPTPSKSGYRLLGVRLLGDVGMIDSLVRENSGQTMP